MTYDHFLGEVLKTLAVLVVAGLVAALFYNGYKLFTS